MCHSTHNMHCYLDVCQNKQTNKVQPMLDRASSLCAVSLWVQGHPRPPQGRRGTSSRQVRPAWLILLAALETLKAAKLARAS